MIDTSPCQSFFEQDPVLYLDLTEPLRRGCAKVISACPTGLLTALTGYDRGGQSFGFSMFAADTETSARLLDLLPPELDLIFVHGALPPADLTQRFGLLPNPLFYQAAYLASSPLPMPETQAVIKPLDLSHLPLLLDSYEYADEAYLLRLLEGNALFGAFHKDTLMGFIGRHAEGTIGLLEVLPPYRRQGIASFLQSYMINLELSLGHIPFAQIFEDNIPSLALQRSLGMSLSSGRAWFFSRD